MSRHDEVREVLLDIPGTLAEIQRLRQLVRDAHRIAGHAFPMACRACDWRWHRPLGTSTAECWEQGKALHAAHVRSLTGETE